MPFATRTPLGGDEPDIFVRLAAAGAYGVVLQEPLFANLPRRARQRALAQR